MNIRELNGMAKAIAHLRNSGDLDIKDGQALQLLQEWTSGDYRLNQLAEVFMTAEDEIGGA